MEFDQCSDYYVYAYLNRPEVQKALHANVTKLNYDWEPCRLEPSLLSLFLSDVLSLPVYPSLHTNLIKPNCSDVIKSWQDSSSTVIPLLKEFMANGIRVWIFR